MPGKIYYSNDEMKADLHEIIRQIGQDSFRPDIIFGVARGGLIPATMLSHYFGVKMMSGAITFRDHMDMSGSYGFDSVDELGALLREGRKVLIVDDICDSGKTLAYINERLSEDERAKLKTAVLWNNTAQDVFESDYVGREISRAEDERWVIFPYEDWWSR